ncbi:hypothetical protein M427DRAFT_169271 [Gonapodya prolifera JEL478]|uniref:UspA domain-containing protein n=1 Tax=Gonapodya prolifera (strain JEL478) TaxID=1344416 RepID=A0A139AZY6_GONPJ|nr:hypothetical protein M427DRAFT_169271 [Gonapodya prolifera JEL478]|eukprot:KXS22306.1 hypothetical protein M427DRAFT_169271 [Gonapodya prolifera JEL478]
MISEPAAESKPEGGPQPITRAETQIIADHPSPAHENPSQITRVLVISLDTSVHSQFAFQWAIDNFIKPENDLVVLVNVRPIATIPSPYGTSVEEQHRIASHLLLQAYAQRLKKKHISVKAIAMRGDPRDEVVRKVTDPSLALRGRHRKDAGRLATIRPHRHHGTCRSSFNVRGPTPYSLYRSAFERVLVLN